jgi:hypothetical protein
MILSTNSRSRAVILTQKGPSANNKNDSKPRATKKPRAIFRSRAIMLSTIQKLRDINSTSNAKRIDPKQDLQITSSSNRQQRLERILRLIFKVQENQLITNIL